MNMSADDVIHDSVRRLSNDVVATLGESYAALVHDEVLRLQQFIAAADPWFLQKLIEDVQQRVHDEFVDTTWPTCPRHANHPLWFKEGWWWCEAENARLAELGSLTTR